MTVKVIKLHQHRHDEVARVFKRAKKKNLTDVIVLGTGPDGSYWCCNDSAQLQTMLFMLDTFKARLMNAIIEDDE